MPHKKLPLSIAKQAWGEGPWQQEPDRFEWVDEASGLHCKIVRHPSLGTLAGYVGVPDTHPAYHIHYNGTPVAEEAQSRDAFKEELRRTHGNPHEMDFSKIREPEPIVGIGNLIRDISVHGGLTFSGQNENDPWWWFGFDCAHAYDLMPGMRALLGPDILDLPTAYKDKYRDFEYVKRECVSLAKQLHEIDVKSRIKIGV